MVATIAGIVVIAGSLFGLTKFDLGKVPAIVLFGLFLYGWILLGMGLK